MAADQHFQSRFLYNDCPGPPSSVAQPSDAAVRFHQTLDGYAQTPLIEWPELAEELGVRRVWAKDESHRLGMPSFKILGVSWGVIAALRDAAPGLLDDEPTIEKLKGSLPDLTLLAATDGNHGHALARVARLLGLRARILVPDNVPGHRVRAIEAEGAEIEVVNGSYDEAVSKSAREASAGYLLVSDTSWPGYENIPGRVTEGYATILREVDEELRARGANDPTVVIVQIGVGALAAAVTRHYLGKALPRPPHIVGVEPLHAASMLASLAAGRPVEVRGPHDSIMSGLNCGVPSMLAWPVLSRGLSAALAIHDDAARDGMRRFARIGVYAGECAGAGPAAAIELLQGRYAACHRNRLGLDSSTEILMFITEGVIDPDDYEAIVGKRPSLA